MTGDVEEAARAKGVQLHILKVGAESEIDAAFPALVQLHAGALLIGGDPFFFSRRSCLWGWRRAMPFRRSMTRVNSPAATAIGRGLRPGLVQFAKPGIGVSLQDAGPTRDMPGARRPRSRPLSG
jgi:hypothetical protein